MLEFNTLSFLYLIFARLATYIIIRPPYIFHITACRSKRLRHKLLYIDGSGITGFQAIATIAIYVQACVNFDIRNTNKVGAADRCNMYFPHATPDLNLHASSACFHIVLHVFGISGIQIPSVEHMLASLSLFASCLLVMARLRRESLLSCLGLCSRLC